MSSARTRKHQHVQVTPGPSLVLPLRWGIIGLPGPAGRGPGVDFCVVFCDVAKRAQTPAAARRGFEPSLAVKNHTKIDPGTLLAGPGSSIIPSFRGSTIDGPRVTVAGVGPCKSLNFAH